MNRTRTALATLTTAIALSTTLATPANAATTYRLTKTCRIAVTGPDITTTAGVDIEKNVGISATITATLANASYDIPGPNPPAPVTIRLSWIGEGHTYTAPATSGVGFVWQPISMRFWRSLTAEVRISRGTASCTVRLPII